MKTTMLLSTAGLLLLMSLGCSPPAPVDQKTDDKTGMTAEEQQEALIAPGDPETQSAPVDWKFTVLETDKIKERNCYRVSIVCLDQGRQQPTTTIWLVADSQKLSRVEAKMLVRGQWRSFTETYVTPAGEPSPVLGPLPALPLDFPAVSKDGTSKNLAGQTYETIYGDTGVKSLGDVGFAFAIDQSVTPTSREYVKTLAPTSEGRGVFEVKLKGAGRTISQLWNSGDPWPIYSNNGMTESRLLEVTRAKANTEDLKQ